MKGSYLEVTYRKGRTLAAYYYLPRPKNETSVRTEKFDGELLVDFSADGKPVGIEILSPSTFELSALNRALAHLGQELVRPEDLAPLAAA